MTTVDLAFHMILYRVRKELRFASSVTMPFKNLDSKLLLECLQVFRSRHQIYLNVLKIIVLLACHRNYTSLQGRIYSKTLSSCETYITVQDNFTISLYFGSFNVYLADFSFQCTEISAPIKVCES